MAAARPGPAQMNSSARHPAYSLEGLHVPWRGIMTGTSTQKYTYDAEIERGRTALAARDLHAAHRHFGRPMTSVRRAGPPPGRSPRPARYAWKQRRIDRAAKQLCLLTAVPLFDGNTHDRDSRVTNGGGAKPKLRRSRSTRDPRHQSGPVPEQWARDTNNQGPVDTIDSLRVPPASARKLLAPRHLLSGQGT